MIPQIDPDHVARVVIPYFLRSLMRIERERLGLSQRDASTQSGWSASVWGALERGSRSLDREQWIAASEALTISNADIAKRLNAFVNKYPSIWLERISATHINICDRPVTSPRIIRSGKVVNVNLNPLRPNLYHELSTYCEDSTEIVAFAVDLDFYSPREAVLPSTSPKDRISSFSEDRLEHMIRFIREMPQDKFGLLERIIDKFEKYPARDLAQAYQHFSLSIKKK
jgi:hypothetical protein